MVGEFIHQVVNPARLAALRRLGLLDSPTEAAFDRLGALAAKVLNAPVALVTLVDDTRQFFKSCRGLPEPWASWRNTPLSHSFCQHVLTTEEPLIIQDARSDPRFAENLAIRDLGVIAYLGIPLKLNTGDVLGSFCVIENHPRIWTQEDVDILQMITASVMTEIELRSEIRHKMAALQEVEKLNRQLSEKTASLEIARQDLESFNHSLTHDLRSPLNAVISFAELIRQDHEASLNADSLALLRRISEAGRRMHQILEGLARLCDTARTDLRITQVDLSGIAEKILGDLQATAPQREVEVQIEADLKAMADSSLIHVALENLLGNAWKFTGKKSEAKIEVGSTRAGEERCFFVRDNGAGFKNDQASKVFLPFERLHSRSDFAGSGIGLATVQQVIKRHGGRIWAEGEVEKGATFYFCLPE